jgi:hypothetical protein
MSDRRDWLGTKRDDTLGIYAAGRHAAHNHPRRLEMVAI